MTTKMQKVEIQLKTITREQKLVLTIKGLSEWFNKLWKLNFLKSI